jgi:hypothetical protein
MFGDHTEHPYMGSFLDRNLSNVVESTSRIGGQINLKVQQDI